MYSTRRCVRVNGGSLAVLFHVLDGRTALASGSFVFRLRYVLSVLPCLYIRRYVRIYIENWIHLLRLRVYVFRLCPHRGLSFECWSSNARSAAVPGLRCSLLRFLRDRLEPTSIAFGLCLTFYVFDYSYIMYESTSVG